METLGGTVERFLYNERGKVSTPLTPDLIPLVRQFQCWCLRSPKCRLRRLWVVGRHVGSLVHAWAQVGLYGHDLYSVRGADLCPFSA